MEQVDGIRVKWQLMKDNVKVKFPKQRPQRVCMKLFLEYSKVPLIERTTGKKKEYPGVISATLLENQYTFSSIINAPCYAEFPGFTLRFPDILDSTTRRRSQNWLYWKWSLDQDEFREQVTVFRLWGSHTGFNEKTNWRPSWRALLLSTHSPGIF